MIVHIHNIGAGLWPSQLIEQGDIRKKTRPGVQYYYFLRYPHDFGHLHVAALKSPSNARKDFFDESEPSIACVVSNQSKQNMIHICSFCDALIKVF